MTAVGSYGTYARVCIPYSFLLTNRLYEPAVIHLNAGILLSVYFQAEL